MNPMDLQGLLAIPNNEAENLQRQGVNLANAMQIPGGVAAMNAPLIGRSAQQNVAKMFGMDVRTTAQKAQEALKGISINTPEGQKQAVDIIQKIDPARAVALQTYFEQANMTTKEKQDKAEELAAQRSAMSQAALRAGNPGLAQQAVAGLFDDKADRFNELLTKGAGDDTKNSLSPTVYKNGTVLVPTSTGVPRVFGPDQRELKGEEAARALSTARQEDLAFVQNSAEARAQGGGNMARTQNVINEGLDAAQGAAVLRRGIDLLESVKTGGVAGAAIKAKQFFGVESGDEGELSSLLGKAVLSQLRTTFGAQFTEREGARLEGIESRMGASPETNARLLKNALTIVERSANTAIEAALSVQDYRTAADIRELLSLTLDEPAAPATGGSRFKVEKVK